MARLSTFLFLLMIICVTNCGEPTDVNLRMTPAERSRIDTLYLAQIDSLRPIWDSICEANFEQNLALAVDSIIQRRRLEEAKLRERYSGE